MYSVANFAPGTVLTAILLATNREADRSSVYFTTRDVTSLVIEERLLMSKVRKPLGVQSDGRITEAVYTTIILVYLIPSCLMREKLPKFNG